MSIKQTLAVAAVATVAIAGAAEARDQIRIVGSSTVFPFATVVAENFGKNTGNKTPVIESTGSGGGMKLFCAGVGLEHPDVTNASRAIKSSEKENCMANGVTPVEIKVGFDGIAFANSKKATLTDYTREQLFLALAKTVPGPDGSLIDNPYMMWSDVDPSLPAKKIEVLGPPPTSGTRDAFVELVMEEACETFDSIAALEDTDKATFKAVCGGIREDGAYIDAGENDNLIVQKLNANPDAYGIFGFAFLDQNSDTVQGAGINGVAPTFETIADGSYPVSRPLYFYVKKEHVGKVPGIAEYTQEFTSDAAAGSEGYLTDEGLIPLPQAMHDEYKAAAASLVPGS